MIAIFVYNLTKVWFRHIWPEIRVPPEEGRDEESRLDIDRWTYLHPQLMTLTELKQVIGNLMKTSELYLQNLLAIRRDRPVAFCSAICFTLSCTAFIGNRICGSTLIFCITTALVTAPGIYLYLLPKSFKDYIKQRISSANFLAAPSELQPESESSSSPPTTASSSSSSSQSSLSDQLRRRIFSVYRDNSNDETTPSAKLNERLDSNVTQPNEFAQPQSSNSGQVDADHQISEAQAEEHSSSSSRQISSQASRKNSDDRSSNESASLIGGSSDDEQHDGFVML